jgi:hypothetical protein
VVGFVLVLVHDSHRRCCLWNEVTPTEGVHHLATGFYNLQFTMCGVFDAKTCHEEVGDFLHLHHQGLRSPHLLKKKSFLQ